ncbi:molybdopterin synthase sulfur carrier subunit [Actinocatenispora thailandica]|uniref:Molybdopterin synthase sulfur carrier subunit n=1 Tax=Actinocatenispora thailandica TaxID=227318 RepID=A0A7R7DN54_9ACTN|nr:ubiquitin-like small modifier protein 1 [Actinocatenispora thailandica]BCJ34693.1 molybdopterin synthase sulfur carrier subunit [Actinocatenispora thailandica]
MTDMSVTVLLPGVLRADAGGSGHLSLELPPGATLRVALDQLAARHPRLDRRLRDDQGALRRYVNLYVDGAECRGLAGLDTPVPAGAELHVIPSVAGG